MFTVAEIIGIKNLKKLREFHDNEIRRGNEHLDKAKELENKIVNEVFSTYLDEEERNRLINQAKAFSFSKEKLTRIEEVFNEYNEDNIDYNIAIDIIDAQTHIKEHKKEGFLSTISKLVINEDD